MWKIYELMKRWFLLFCVSLFALFSAVAQPNVDERLRQIAEQDQQVRLRLIECQQRGELDSLIHYAEQMVSIDAENQAYVAALLARGLPDGLSEQAYEALFLVVDHADLDYQRRYFRQLRRASREGKISRSSICTLHDRIMMRSNRRQLYGTQTQSAVTLVEGEEVGVQECYVWPVRRARILDKRRERSGMGTMQMQAEAHRKIGYRMVWDRELTVREFRRMIEKK